MGAKINWKRARKIGPTESVLGVDVEMKNGQRTPIVRKDSLAARAAAAEEKWRKSLTESQRAKFDYAEKPKANRIPRKPKFTGRRAKLNRLGPTHK
jgi:hypothetical protein